MSNPANFGLRVSSGTVPQMGVVEAKTHQKTETTEIQTGTAVNSIGRAASSGVKEGMGIRRMSMIADGGHALEPRPPDAEADMPTQPLADRMVSKDAALENVHITTDVALHTLTSPDSKTSAESPQIREEIRPQREAIHSGRPMAASSGQGRAESSTGQTTTAADYDKAKKELGVINPKIQTLTDGKHRLKMDKGKVISVKKGITSSSTKKMAKKDEYTSAAKATIQTLKSAQQAGISVKPQIDILSGDKEFSAILSANKDIQTEFQGDAGVVETERDLQEAIDTHAEHILGSYTPAGSNLEHSATHARLPVSKQGLRELCSEAHQTPVEMGHRFVTVEKENFLVSKNGDGSVNLLHVSSQPMGRGNFGEVFKVTDLSTGKMSVLKAARPEKGEVAVEDLRNESSLLRFAHGQGRLPGIQAPPSQPFTFTDASGTQRTGYLTQAYNGGKMYDNKNFKPDGMSLDDKLDCMTQVVTGLDHMVEIGIKHGDLKPNNTLLNHNDDGSWELSVSDFGGCVRYEDLTPAQVRADPYAGGKDPAYMTSEDKRLLEGLSQQFPDDDKALMERFQDLSEKRDAYAMGRTLWQLVTGDEAGAISGDQAPRYTKEDGTVDDTLRDQLASYGPALNDLKGVIGDLCKTNPDDRISIAEARQRMEAIKQKYSTEA